ncbi:MAG: hypothetical protein WBB85_01100, partial [Albidovulum sp.]
LDTARGAAGDSAKSLREMTTRAEAAAAKLELMLATLHDLPEPNESGERKFRVVRRRGHGDDRMEAAE